jgi:hypothetical protein
MQPGQWVTAKLYGGGTAARRVVADKGDVVVICADEEYAAALREKREPSGLGFPREDVLESVPAKKGVGTSGQDTQPLRMSGD